MSIYSNVFPHEASPGKTQMETMLSQISEDYITPQIRKDLQLETDINGFFIRAPLHKARRIFKKLYDDLPIDQKLYCQIPFFNSGCAYLKAILDNMEESGFKHARVFSEMLTDNQVEFTRKLVKEIYRHRSAGCVRIKERS